MAWSVGAQSRIRDRPAGSHDSPAPAGVGAVCGRHRAGHRRARGAAGALPGDGRGHRPTRARAHRTGARRGSDRRPRGGRVARDRRAPVAIARRGAPPARPGRDQEPWCAVPRRQGPGTRVDVAGRISDQRVCGARGSHSHGSVFLVPETLALGRERLALRIAAHRSSRASRHGGPRVGIERLALDRARTARDARYTVGPAVVSFTSRGGILEGPRAPGSPAASQPHVSVAEAGVVTITPIGRVVATELKPATPHQFHFWTATETSIGIGAIVKVGGGGTGDEGRVVYGVVTEGVAYSDLATPLHDVVGAEGDPTRAEDAPTA